MPASRKKTGLVACILAAGLGTRMRSSTPKLLHPLAGKPILAHLLETVSSLAVDDIHVVIGKGGDEVKRTFEALDEVTWIVQGEQLGTGHAVMQAMPGIPGEARVLILLGDAPLVSAGTLSRLAALDADLGVLSVILEDPSNYGRIVRDDGGRVLEIVEDRDASEAQRAIAEINTGVMVARADCLNEWLAKLDTNNDQHEYLLTDIVKIAAGEGASVECVVTADEDEVRGINNFAQLAYLEKVCQRRQAQQLMQDGVRIMDPERFDLRGSLQAGRDVVIDSNNLFEGHNLLGDNVRIGPNCVIRDSRIGNNCIIKANSVVEESVVGDNCVVGPFARLRPGTELEADVAIGNFVEIKKSRIGRGSKANHLAYLGDASVGRDVNIGAGTITCNYDGVAKHQTRIEDFVFVGSNTAIVAPVTIGEGATIGAGSTITKDVGEGVLALGRGRQKAIENWKGPRK